MNMWIAKGKRIKAEDLLGSDFMQELGGGKFKSRKEWLAHKADLQKMARWHSQALRDMRAGKRAKKIAISLNTMQKDRRGH